MSISKQTLYSAFYSGADLAALVREASVNSLRECMRGNQGTSSMILDVADCNEMKQDTVTGVAMRHFEAAFKKIKPSVSEKVGLLFCMNKTFEDEPI